MFRFIHSMVQSKGQIENDSDACVYCGKCEKICPAHAIRVDSSHHTWSIDHEVCVRCERCVRSCPKHALSLAKNR